MIIIIYFFSSLSWTRPRDYVGSPFYNGSRSEGTFAIVTNARTNTQFWAFSKIDGVRNRHSKSLNISKEPQPLLSVFGVFKLKVSFFTHELKQIKVKKKTTTTTTTITKKQNYTKELAFCLAVECSPLSQCPRKEKRGAALALWTEQTQGINQNWH